MFYLKYLFIFSILFLSSSFIAIGTSGKIVYMFYLLIIILMYIVLPKRKINLKNIILYFLLGINVLITIIANLDIMYNYIIWLIAIIVGFELHTHIKFDEFAEIYNKIMSFLAVFSLLFYALSYINRNLWNIFPIVDSSARGYDAYNLFFSVLPIGLTGPIRNWGIFWEPGAYQTFLAIALILELFYLKKKSIIRIILWIMAMLSTISTTGYIVCFFIMIAYIFNSNINKKIDGGFDRKMKILVALGGVGSLSMLFVLPQSYIFQLFGKLSVLWNPSLIDANAAYSSTTIRIASVIEPLREFLLSPFTGKGYTEFFDSAVEKGYMMNTCTFVNWFAIFGLITAVIMCIGIVGFIGRMRLNHMAFFILLVAFLFSMLSEDYHRNPFILAIIFWGVANIKGKIKVRHRTLVRKAVI